MSTSYLVGMLLGAVGEALVVAALIMRVRRECGAMPDLGEPERWATVWHGVTPCVRKTGHTGWHEDDAGQRWRKL